MADTIRHAACAHTRTWSLDENQALRAIVDGVSNGLREQFGRIATIQEGSLN